LHPIRPVVREPARHRYAKKVAEAGADDQEDPEMAPATPAHLTERAHDDDVVFGVAALALASGATVWFVLSGTKHGDGHGDGHGHGHGHYDIKAEVVAIDLTHNKDRASYTAMLRDDADHLRLTRLPTAANFPEASPETGHSQRRTR
jgi:hypothetical protein